MSTVLLRKAAARSPSPLWGGVRGGGNLPSHFTNLPWRAGRLVTPIVAAVGARGDQVQGTVHFLPADMLRRFRRWRGREKADCPRAFDPQRAETYHA
ncbi:hypothetical protein C7I84_15745 [Mesorhizobium ephedrae]|uniref:Uncharacterized protein n=1 Tax=Kumtagia ephedrae TaxID=2116701 RepID=A0A2P7S7G7_9HYPH|nr:hypothetical protein C7I84_15745 [Mesorhizobium ephedrae]